MPLYFFHTADGAVRLDKDGVELADHGEAQREAACLAGELLRDDPDQLWRTETLSVTVISDTGLTVCTVHVAGITAPALSVSPQSSVPST